MDKEQLQPLSGFRDYQGNAKYWVAETLRGVFESFGYVGLETPSLEKQELLLNKYGEDAQKLLYLFEDNGSRKIGLRYDLTLPLARFVAANLNELTLPYKRYEIGNAWRAERAQKGRLRQFTQADIDIIGAQTLSAEREIVEVLKAVSAQLNLEFKVLINDRRVVTQIFEKLKVDEKDSRQLMRILDKKDKLTDEAFNSELKELALTDVQRRQVNAIFLVDEAESVEGVEKLLGDSQELKDLLAFVKLANKLGIKAEYAANMVRGLDYYTGTIFECVADNYPATLIAGGRYDTLVESLNGQKIPAVGISFGVDRIIEALGNKKLEEIIFIANLPETSDQVLAWAQELREGGKNVEVYLDSKVELGKQIKYADKKGYAKILIPFEDEWATGKVIVKDLQSGNQTKEDIKKLS
jgi:histidyl-tRNA synthetase